MKGENEMSEEVSYSEFDPQAKKKPGRKPKTNDGRFQVSAYFTNELYEAVKDLALYSDTSITEIIVKLCENFIANNSETLEQFREYSRNKKELNFGI